MRSARGARRAGPAWTWPDRSATPWDAMLGQAMNAAGVARHEEALLEVLLGDLGTGPAPT